MSPKMMEIANEEVKRLHKEGIIERSASDYCSAPVIVKKKDGNYRFCVDYRDLNTITRKDEHPIPNMDSILDKLRNARYLSTIDLKQAYFQIPMEGKSKRFTAFAVPGSGLWQFTRMPFGLTNSPRTFQRLIDTLFGPEYEPFIFGYLDDIIIATDTFEEHLHWLEFVLTTLNKAGLKVNIKKCEFCCAQVLYLGFLLDKNGLRPDPSRIEPIMNFPIPKNIKELKSFLGIIGWYSRFIEKEAEWKIPLVRLLRKSIKWNWTEEQQEAFEKLKIALTGAPVLIRPDSNKPFSVQCDASNYAMGAVLTQEDEEGREHPIVYISKVLNLAQLNYTTTEKECLAVVWAIKKFRPYIEGYKFKVFTDHRALKWLKTMNNDMGRLGRWALELQHWEFEVEHKKGSLNIVPDALSRIVTNFENEVAAFGEIKDVKYRKLMEEIQQNLIKYEE